MGHSFVENDAAGETGPSVGGVSRTSAGATVAEAVIATARTVANFILTFPMMSSRARGADRDPRDAY